MFGDSHSKGAVTSAPELGLGGQQVRPLQGMSLQPLLQFLLHIAHIPPVTPALTMPAQTLQQDLLPKSAEVRIDTDTVLSTAPGFDSMAVGSNV